MAIGALPEEELEQGGALTPQPGDVDVGAGADQMAALELAKRSEETGTMIEDPAALAEYKQKRELERSVDEAFARRKDYNRDGKKDNLWQRFKGWGSRAWNKGKDDPLTPEREDKTEEVTKFMGGMTRQELSMFLFEWGGLMMANSEKGLGGAAGAAGLGAMQGHQGRQALALSTEGEAQERALREREVSAKEYETKVGKNNELLERIRQPDGSFRWEPVTDKDGKIITIKDPGNRPYQGQGVWEQSQWQELGYSDDMIAEIQQGGLSPSAMYDRMHEDLLQQKARAQEKEKMSQLPDNMKQKIENLNGEMVPITTISNNELAKIARRDADFALGQRGALRPNAPKRGEDYIQ
jgi:hypothetical protein